MQSSDTQMTEALVGGQKVDATSGISTSANNASEPLVDGMETKTMSFAEIVRGRNASVRMTDDKMLHAVDLVLVAHGGSRDYAAHVSSKIIH